MNKLVKDNENEKTKEDKTNPKIKRKKQKSKRAARKTEHFIIKEMKNYYIFLLDEMQEHISPFKSFSSPLPLKKLQLQYY